MIKIIADTTSCIAVDEAEKLGIYYVPQLIIFVDETFRDDRQMSSADFIEKSRKSTVFPKTAAPYPHLYTPIYDELDKHNDSGLVICPSAKVSGTVRSAETAYNDYKAAHPKSKLDIRIVDSAIISSGLMTIIMKALELSKTEKNIDILEKQIQEYSQHNRTYFLVDTLEFLQRGGRIGAAKALIGGLLETKPILAFRNGQTEPQENVRTKKRALSRLVEIIQSECPAKPSANISIMHGDALEEANALRDQLINVLNIKDILVTEIPPAILVHAGPGVLGGSFFVD